ncbi:hypothetical protein M8J75_004428 [Diaphorina citri]|nr:hypothetical protein M8J75_004428 [Diaphorina citri]
MRFDNCVKAVFFVALGFIVRGVSSEGSTQDESKTESTTGAPSPTTVNKPSSTSDSTPNSPTTVTGTPTTSVSPSPSTVAPEVSFTLEKQEYLIKVYIDQKGVLEQFKTVPKVAGIQYEVVYNDATTKTHLEQLLEIDPDTGVLRTKQTINPGDYTFSIKASLKLKDSTKTSTAKVNIKVEATVCTKDDKPQFQYAFLKKHISENKQEIILTEATKTKCEYSLNQKPQGDFFILNPTTGKLESNGKIDRESEIFHNQVQPHFNLEINIKCSSARKKRSVQTGDENLEVSLQKFQSDGIVSLTNYKNPFEQLQARLVRGILNFHSDDSKPNNEDNKSSTPSSSEKPSEASTQVPVINEKHCYDVTKEPAQCDSIIEDNILYNTQFVKLLIVVDDVNDNPPEFSEKEYFFAYPGKKLFAEIVPENIGMIQATDKDTGLNAAIKYSVKNMPDVLVDPCTGTLYPHYANFKYQKLTFEITATDREGQPDGLSKTVPVTIDILEGYHIMKMLIKRTLTQSNKDILTKLEEYLKGTIKVLEVKTVPSMEEISGSIELDTKGYDILDYYVIYIHRGQTLLDMNEVTEELKKNKDLNDKILWSSVLASSPFHYVQSKSFVSSMVVIMLILCVGSLIFYIAYIRTGKYYRCFNYFKKTDSTTPLERDEGSIGTSDYVVSFARMHHVNPTFNVVETDGNKDFTPVTLKAYDTASTQIINVDELTPAPPILVNSNSNSRRNSVGGEDNLGLTVGNETRVRRKSTVSFNEIVEQYHTVHN